jgi:hypothetical protein
VWVNLRVDTSVRKAASVAFRAPIQPHCKDLRSTEIVTLGLIHQVHSNSSNFIIYCLFDYPMHCCVLKCGYPV